MFVDLVDDNSDEMLSAAEPNLQTNESSLSIYLDGIRHEGRVDLEQSNALITGICNRAGQCTERIRGGGTSDASEPNESITDHQSNYLYLCDVPRQQWKGKAVYTYVQTASQGSVCSDALLVGFVTRSVEASTQNEERPHKVEIEAYYLSGKGYFENTTLHQSDSDEVWFVNIDQDCEEARVVAKLCSQNKLHADYQEKEQRATLRHTIPNDNPNEDERAPSQNISCDEQEKEHESVFSQAELSNIQAGRRGEKSTKGMSFSDYLCLGFDRTPYRYTCERKLVGSNSPVDSHNGSHECSLCSLPFESYLVCKIASKRRKNDSESKSYRGLGCSLMSDMGLTENPSDSNDDIPGLLGEGKTLLLKIARLVPNSLKVLASYSLKQVDPLSCFRVFDNVVNYDMWKTYVAECTCTEMLAQALVVLLASIERTKLPDWWSHKGAGWSTSYAIMAEPCLSSLYLHLYVLDAALSDTISRSLKEANNYPDQEVDDANFQQQRMKEYWERAMSLGYIPFEGTNKEECYHCEDGGHLLCCELCPNVQHPECCDPKLSINLKLDHWLCDSCINDIDNFEADE